MIKLIVSALLFLVTSAKSQTLTTINENLWTTGNWQYFDTSINGASVFAGTVSVMGNAFSVGGSTLVVRGGNVGIGTTNPQDPLDVAGNIGFNLPNGSTSYFFQPNYGNNYSGQIRMQAGFGSAAGGGGIVLGGQINGARPGSVIAGIGSGSGGVFAVNNQGLGQGTDLLTVQAGGNVGIGTTSPATPLDINGQATIRNNLFMDFGATGNPQITFNQNGVNRGYLTYWNAGGNINLQRSGSSTSNGISINSSDQVGISTNNPTSALSVYGITTSSTTIPAISCTAGAPAMTAGSTSEFGSFSAGALATGCTVTFGTAFPNAHVFCECQASANLAVWASATSATAVTCTAASALTGDTITYLCRGGAQ